MRDPAAAVRAVKKARMAHRHTHTRAPAVCGGVWLRYQAHFGALPLLRDLCMRAAVGGEGGGRAARRGAAPKSATELSFCAPRAPGASTCCAALAAFGRALGPLCAGPRVTAVLVVGRKP